MASKRSSLGLFSPEVLFYYLFIFLGFVLRVNLFDVSAFHENFEIVIFVLQENAGV